MTPHTKNNEAFFTELLMFLIAFSDSDASVGSRYVVDSASDATWFGSGMFEVEHNKREIEFIRRAGIEPATGRAMSLSFKKVNP